MKSILAVVLKVVFFSIIAVSITPIIEASDYFHEEYPDDYPINCSELFDAIYFGDIVRIRSSISNGDDINQSFGDKTPLILAIERKNIDIVHELILLGADLNQVAVFNGRIRSCPIAAALNQPEILMLLLESGADVNRKLYRRATTLHLAAAKGITGLEDAYKSLNILLEFGADVDAKDLDGNTSLHLAAKYKNAKSIGKLLDYGADLYKVDDEQKNALHHIYFSCDKRMLQELVIRKIPLNDKSCKWSALHLACMQNGLSLQKKMELIQWLIEEQKMNVNEYAIFSSNQTTCSTLTAFGYAVGAQKCYEDNFTILEYLVDVGADINAPCMISQYSKPRHQHVGYESIIKWAEDTRDIPSYVIDWLVDQGAR